MAFIYKVTNQFGALTSDEMENNAWEIYAQLSEYGWTVNSVSAVLGNMQAESGLNPAQTQHGFPVGSRKGGYGLIQWTPASKYYDWANKYKHNIYDGYWQLYDLNYQAHYQEYYEKPAYPLSYEEFKESDDTPAYLTEVFLFNYVRAGVEVLEKRVEYAEYWYEILSGEEPPKPPEPLPQVKKGLPVWMMVKYY